MEAFLNLEAFWTSDFWNLKSSNIESANIESLTLRVKTFELSNFKGSQKLCKIFISKNWKHLNQAFHQNFYFISWSFRCDYCLICPFKYLSHIICSVFFLNFHLYLSNKTYSGCDWWKFEEDWEHFIEWIFLHFAIVYLRFITAISLHTILSFFSSCQMNGVCEFRWLSKAFVVEKLWKLRKLQDYFFICGFTIVNFSFHRKVLRSIKKFFKWLNAFEYVSIRLNAFR